MGRDTGLRPAAGLEVASPSGNPHVPPPMASAPNLTRHPVAMVLAYLAQVVVLAVVTVLYGVYRSPLLFDAVIAVAVVMVAVALAMTVWVLRIPTR